MAPSCRQSLDWNPHPGLWRLSGLRNADLGRDIPASTKPGCVSQLPGRQPPPVCYPAGDSGEPSETAPLCAPRFRGRTERTRRPVAPGPARPRGEGDAQGSGCSRAAFLGNLLDLSPTGMPSLGEGPSAAPPNVWPQVCAHQREVQSSPVRAQRVFLCSLSRSPLVSRMRHLGYIPVGL